MDNESNFEERDLLAEENGEQDSESKFVVQDEEFSNVRLDPCARIGALLFVSPRPLSLEQLSKASRLSENSVREALGAISESFNLDRLGISLEEVNQKFQIRTLPSAAPFIKALFPPKAKRLSKAAAETLAVIAYKQPVQKAEIEAIRGVDALPTLKTLLDAQLIKIIGREDSPGNPALYGTTEKFLEKFGLSDLSELPTPREIEQFVSDPGESKDFEGDSEQQDFISDNTQGE